MAYSNGIITAPVHIDDIRAALGEVSTDLGTLCTSPKIKEWSMAKPVRLAAPFPTSGTIPGSPWWRADGACGFDIPYTNYYPLDGSAPTELINICKQGWTYQRPTGGAQSPYRMGDFRGYDNRAVAPFTHLHVTEKVAKGQTIQIALSLGITGDSDEPPGSVRLKHISHPHLSGDKRIADYYFGILITSPDGKRKFIGTAETHEHAFQITVPDNWINGTYDVYPFLSSLKINPENGQTIPEAGVAFILIPAPGIKDLPAQFEITDKAEALGYGITIDATSSSLTGIVSVSIRITPPATLTNPKIKSCTVAYIQNGATIATQTIATPTLKTPMKTSYNYDKNNGGVAPDRVHVRATVSHPAGINDTTIEESADVRRTITSSGTFIPEVPLTPLT